jgi:hypothetical protein
MFTIRVNLLMTSRSIFYMARFTMYLKNDQGDAHICIALVPDRTDY